MCRSRFMSIRKPATVTSMLCDVCLKRRNDGDHAACASLKKQKELERSRYEQCLADLDEAERAALLDAYDAVRSFEVMFELLGQTQRIVDPRAHNEQTLLSALILGFEYTRADTKRAADS
jgi:hypothetical protein